MNETRAYLESDIWHARVKKIELPERVNITLENWDMPNMGGDFLALLINSAVCSIIVVIVETACFYWISKKVHKFITKTRVVEIRNVTTELAEA